MGDFPAEITELGDLDPEITELGDLADLPTPSFPGSPSWEISQLRNSQDLRVGRSPKSENFQINTELGDLPDPNFGEFTELSDLPT